MSASLPPNNGLKIKLGSFCVYVNRRVALLIVSVAIAGGGGGWALTGLATGVEVDGVRADVKSHITADEDRSTKVDDRLNGHDEQLEMITVKIGSIQEVQHWQVADQSAERVCQQTPSRARQDCYKRLFKWSLDRLRREKLPCTNLNCSD